MGPYNYVFPELLKVIEKLRNQLAILFWERKVFVERDFSAHYSARPNPKLLFHSLMKSFEKKEIFWQLRRRGGRHHFLYRFVLVVTTARGQFYVRLSFRHG